MTLRRSPSTAIAGICGIGLLLALSCPVHAQQHAIIPSAPPPPVAIETQCMDGESVTLTLRSSTRSIQQLKFLIRKGPRLGELSEVQVIDRTTAVVEYRHHPENGTGMEEITYAVQAPNTPVSVASKIQIVVKKPPPILEAKAALEFGEVPVGETSRQSLVISNSGGSPMSLSLKSEPPWEFDGKTSFTVEAGESVTTDLVFRPTEVRQFVQKIDYTGAPEKSALQLSGVGISPFAFTQKEITLAIDPKGEIRSGVVSLSNNTSAPLEVSLHTDDKLEIPETVEIPAKGTVEIPVRVKAGEPAGVDTALEAQSDAYSAKIGVKAFPAPPKVISQSGDSIDFGKMQRGRLYRRNIQLTNIGGASARVSVRLPDGVHVLPDPESITLAPGKTETFEILYEPKTDEVKPETVHFSFGARSLAVTLTGRLDEGGEREVAPRPKPTPVPPSDVPQVDDYLSGIPQITQIGVKPGKRSLLLVWKLPAPDAFKFILEERHLKLVGPKRLPFPEWRRIPAKIERKGEMVEATLQNVRPGSLLNLRIISEDPLGYLSEPSPTFRVEMPATPPFRFPWWIFGILAAGAAGVFYRRHRQEQMRRLEAETDRISGRI